MTEWSCVSLDHWDRDKPFCKEIINKGTTNINFCYIRRKAKISPNCLDTVKLLKEGKNSIRKLYSCYLSLDKLPSACSDHHFKCYA